MASDHLPEQAAQTGSSNRHFRFDESGKRVCVHCGGPLQRVHHIGSDGFDWGPTGFLECQPCILAHWDDPPGTSIGWEWE